MDRTTYKNQHIKDHYDRINFVVPKGEKDRIKEAADEMQISVNEYLYMLVCDDLSTGKSKLSSKKQGFTEEQQKMLDKWQVPRKYHEMIEDMSYIKEEGYYIYLKDGYINDVTGNRSIHCEKTAELRRIVNKSHKK